MLLNSKATKLEETIDRMKSAEKEHAKQLSEERKRDIDHQETIEKVNDLCKFISGICIYSKP